MDAPSDGGETQTVLVVEDETGLADLYSAWLADDYDVRVANTGAAALERFDADVDVVLLDRRLPDVAGREVLEALRAGSPECQVAMVTAVEPAADVLEMGFDDYVNKPVERDELRALVANLVSRREYDERLQQYFRLLSKRAALERELDGPLAERPAFSDLLEGIAAIEAELDGLVEEFTAADFDAQFHRASGTDDAAGD